MPVPLPHNQAGSYKVKAIWVHSETATYRDTVTEGKKIRKLKNISLSFHKRTMHTTGNPPGEKATVATSIQAYRDESKREAFWKCRIFDFPVYTHLFQEAALLSVFPSVSACMALQHHHVSCTPSPGGSWYI